MFFYFSIKHFFKWIFNQCPKGKHPLTFLLIYLMLKFLSCDVAGLNIDTIQKFHMCGKMSLKLRE